MRAVAQRMVLTAGLYIIGMFVLVAVTSSVTGRGFWETVSSLWIALVIFFGVCLWIAYRGDGFRD